MLNKQAAVSESAGQIIIIIIIIYYYYYYYFFFDSLAEGWLCMWEICLLRAADNLM